MSLQIPEHWMLEGAQSMRVGKLPWSYSSRGNESFPNGITYDDLIAILVIPYFVCFDSGRVRMVRC